MKAIKTILLVGFIFTQFFQMQIQMAKADTWSDIFSNSSIHKAAAEGDVDRVKSLLEGGTDVNAVDEFGDTALHKAANYGRYEISEFLIEKGIDIDAKNNFGETALHKAFIMGHSRGVKILIDAGADIDGENYRNETAVDAARRWGKSDSEIVKIIENQQLWDSENIIIMKTKEGRKLTPAHTKKLKPVARKKKESCASLF